MNDWKFETIESIPDNIECKHVFFHPALINTWMETYKSLRRLTPINVKAEKEGLELYMPLVLWHRNWKNAFEKIVVPVGYSDFDYHDPLSNSTVSIVSPQSFWSGLSEYVLKEYDCNRVIIDGITDDATYGEVFEKGEICPQLSLKGFKNEDDLMSFFKTSLRGDLRRQMRRLSELGELKFTEYNSWEEIPTETFKKFMHQHTIRWPNAYKAPHFHENLLKNGLRAGVVHFSVLSVGEIDVAWHLGFSYKGCFYYYMPAGNQEYFKYSPTKVHLFYLVRLAIARGFDTFDHLRGEENYKSGWSNGSQYVNTLTRTNDSSLTRLKERLVKIRRIIGK